MKTFLTSILVMGKETKISGFNAVEDPLSSKAWVLFYLSLGDTNSQGSETVGFGQLLSLIFDVKTLDQEVVEICVTEIIWLNHLVLVSSLQRLVLISGGMLYLTLMGTRDTPRCLV